MKKTLARNAELIHIEPMRVFILFFLCLFVFSMPHNVWAAKNDSRQEKLKDVETTLKKEKEKQEKLQRDQDALEKRVKELRRNMIDVTAKIQKQEKAILSVQDEQEASAKEMAAARDELEQHHESLAVMITALQRIGRVPPEALLARPSAPIDMARSFSVMEKIVPEVSKQAGEMKVMIDQIALLRQAQEERAAILAAERKALDAKQSQLEKMVKKRETLMADNEAQQQKSQREASALARQARDLRELMAKIERQKPPPVPKVVARREAATVASLESTGRNIVRSLKDWFGKSTSLPVAGEVVTGYGDKMPGGGVSRGLRIKATGGAVVTMPLTGIVRFAGPFRQYKLLVIVQHDNGDHSLLGGMQELYIKTGARLATGEPLGKLPKLEGDSTRSTSLYYERRRKGKPIDPRRA